MVSLKTKHLFTAFFTTTAGMTVVQFTTFNKDGKTLKKVTIPTLIKETVNKYCGLRSSAVEEEGGLRQFLINKHFPTDYKEMNHYFAGLSK